MHGTYRHSPSPTAANNLATEQANTTGHHHLHRHPSPHGYVICRSMNNNSPINIRSWLDWFTTEPTTADAGASKVQHECSSRRMQRTGIVKLICAIPTGSGQNMQDRQL
uniref:Uncharacterized protein n=1 Tax=Anopheles melas TaxID=34690 RepID=A0A182TZQ1_9DIPT